jgi:acetyl esterase
MKTSLFAYIHFIFIFLHLKLKGLSKRQAPLPGGVLDAQTKLMRRAQEVLGEAPLDQKTPAQARQDFKDTFTLLKKIGGLFEKVASIRDLTIPSPAGGLPARLYLPGTEKNYPMLVFFHGGGWVIGDLETGDNIARYLCAHVPCAVLSVEYRLAPEHPFPAAVEDALTATAWAAGHAAELNADPRRLLVGGDSAGGTLSATVAMQSGRQGFPALAGQVLFYPGTDCASLETESYRLYGGGFYGLPKRDVEWFLDQYVPDPVLRLDERCSPLRAYELGGLPPALVVTAEFDVLRDEGEAYARRLQQAGVPVTLLRCNGAVHGFLSTIGLIRRAGAYADQIAAEVRRLASG